MYICICIQVLKPHVSFAIIIWAGIKCGKCRFSLIWLVYEREWNVQRLPRPYHSTAFKKYSFLHTKRSKILKDQMSGHFGCDWFCLFALYHCLCMYSSKSPGKKSIPREQPNQNKAMKIADSVYRVFSWEIMKCPQHRLKRYSILTSSSLWKLRYLILVNRLIPCPLKVQWLNLNVVVSWSGEQSANTTTTIDPVSNLQMLQPPLIRWAICKYYNHHWSGEQSGNTTTTIGSDETLNNVEVTTKYSRLLCHLTILDVRF